MYNRRLLFISACAGILFFGMAITTLGSVLPDLRTKFMLDDLQAGAIFSILPFGILVGSLLFGPVADRYGYRGLLALTCFSMAAGFIGIAATGDLFVLKICVFLFGLGGGAINGATSALVSDISATDKGANLSILGVAFAVGALGMPLVLAIMENRLSYTTILIMTGIATFAMGVIFLLLRFPAAKQAGGLVLSKMAALLKSPFLLLVSFFLFFQSAFEGIMNNWTTSYLTAHLQFPQKDALFILSLFVAGMTVMRLMLASVFRKSNPQTIWSVTFFLLFSGLLILNFAQAYAPVLAGFVCIGAGLAAGFPIMLSYLGERFQEMSGTAFSIAFSIALAGNILLNYSMGYIAQNYGIRHLISMGFFEFAVMTILAVVIVISVLKGRRRL